MNEFTVDHIGIAVASLDQAIPLWESLSGATATDREIVDSQGVEVVFIGSGTTRVELLAPTHDESPIARFLDRSGSGIHHIAYRVPDIREALTAAEQQGQRLIDREPRTGAHDHLVAFIHPRTTGGVLLEYVQHQS